MLAVWKLTGRNWGGTGRDGRNWDGDVTGLGTCLFHRSQDTAPGPAGRHTAFRHQNRTYLSEVPLAPQLCPVGIRQDWEQRLAASEASAGREGSPSASGPASSGTRKAPFTEKGQHSLCDRRLLFYFLFPPPGVLIKFSA